MEKKTFQPRRSSTLLRRAAAFAVLMLAAQTALWAYKVTLQAGRGEGEVIVLDSEDQELQATDNDNPAEGQFYMKDGQLRFRLPFCPTSFTAPAGEFFRKWYVNEEGGTEMGTGMFLDINANLLLIAKWSTLEIDYVDGGVYTKYAETNNSPREVKLIEIGWMNGENLTIPASVEYGNESYSVVEIADGVGANNNKLTTLTIPATVRRIGTGAFSDCGNLGTVTFEEGSQLTSVGENAFYVCYSLKYIYNIPYTVKCEGGIMFESHGKLEEVTIWGNNGSLGDVWDITWEVPSVKMTVPANKFGDDYWTTFYNGEESFQADESTKVYKAKLNGSSLQLHEVADRIINRSKPVILKYTPPQGQTATGNIVLTNTKTESSDEAPNDLKPSASGWEIEPVAYVLYGGAEGLGFYKFNGTKLSDGKAYISVPASSPVRGYMGFMEETVPGETDIQNPSAPGVQEGAAEGWYTLDGRALSGRPATPGLYIQKGRKVMIK